MQRRQQILGSDGGQTVQLKTKRPSWKVVVRNKTRVLKRLIDIVGSVLLLTLLAPLMAACALLIKWQDGGAAFYRRRVVGPNGEFDAFKLRTMCPGADAILHQSPSLRREFELNSKVRNDPRITALGAWLRKLSLDECPQLWNVLRGEMSLVGPRMITPAELLRAGHSVVVVDDLSTGFRQAVPRGTPLHQSDIADPRAMRFLLSENKFDAVFHFAAKALVPESESNPGVFFQQNVAGGISFLEAVRAAGVKKFVFSSSAAVYGAPQTVPIDEEHAKEPTNSYGETKLMLERALEWYASAYHWSVVALRYFNAAGATEAAERH